MPTSLQPLSRVVAADATLAAWDARRRREEALTRAVRQHLPRALASRVRACDGEGGELELLVETGAVATIVRQRTPDLASALRGDGWQFAGIKLRVQVRNEPVSPARPATEQVDAATLRPMADLARKLPKGPLKTALERLLRRIG